MTKDTVISNNKKARLDTDKTAKPIMEIVAHYSNEPANLQNTYHNYCRYKYGYIWFYELRECKDIK